MARYSTHRRKKDRSARRDDASSWSRCSCGKRSFQTLKAAREAQRAVRAANARDGIPAVSATGVLRPYRCETGGFHLGHETSGGRPNLNDGRLRFLPETG
jgi:hypothetical protein